MPSEWTWREYHHRHGNGYQRGKGNEDDLEQLLEEQCSKTCELVTFLELSCIKKQGTGLGGELFSLPCVPDGTGRE